MKHQLTNALFAVLVGFALNPAPAMAQDFAPPPPPAGFDGPPRHMPGPPRGDGFQSRPPRPHSYDHRPFDRSWRGFGTNIIIIPEFAPPPPPPRDFRPRRYCNIRACEDRYRSFRASDCSYQPYNGPRRECRL